MSGGRLSFEKKASLPEVIAEGVSGVVGEDILVGAGTNGEATGRMMYRFSEGKWNELGWPEEARGRMYAISGGRVGSFISLAVVIWRRVKRSKRIGFLDWIF